MTLSDLASERQTCLVVTCQTGRTTDRADAFILHVLPRAAAAARLEKWCFDRDPTGSRFVRVVAADAAPEAEDLLADFCEAGLEALPTSRVARFQRLVELNGGMAQSPGAAAAPVTAAWGPEPTIARDLDWWGMEATSSDIARTILAADVAGTVSRKSVAPSLFATGARRLRWEDGSECARRLALRILAHRSEPEFIVSQFEYTARSWGHRPDRLGAHRAASMAQFTAELTAWRDALDNTLASCSREMAERVWEQIWLRMANRLGFTPDEAAYIGVLAGTNLDHHQ